MGIPACFRKCQKVLVCLTTGAYQNSELPKNFDMRKWSLLNMDFGSMNSKLGRFAMPGLFV